MPELSPELAARIETLRASHAENPARFFMPLASAYREAGEVQKAEELLRENLKRHPGYLSAHVLLGRCLADRGAYAEARNEFQYVLSVDAQNLIALRTLGDMAASGDDAGEARRWYGELLSVDPMNTEARQALAALDAAGAARATAAAQPSAPSPAEAEGNGFGMVDLDANQAPAADHPAAHADPGTWGTVSLETEAASARPVPQEAGGDFDALDFGAVDIDAHAHGEPAREEATPPAEEADHRAFAGFGTIDGDEAGLDAAEVAPLDLEALYPSADASAGAHHDDHDEHGEVVTETIAELYARQGFPERAADVYRELIARRGDEPALVRRLEELQEQLRSHPAGESAPNDLEPVAFDVPSAESAGSGEPAEAAETAGEAPSWLQTVDAIASGEQAPSPAPSDDAHEPVDFGFAPLDLPSGEPEPAAAPSAEAPFTAGTADATGGAEPALAGVSGDAGSSADRPAAYSTGDPFADSFAAGFDGAAAPPQSPEAQAEETEPAPELAGAASFAATLGDPAEAGSAEAAPGDQTAETTSVESAAAHEEPAHGGHTIVTYLSAILSWRPGTPSSSAPAEPPASASAGSPGTADAAAPPHAHPWDAETLGAAEEQPPMDEPWIAGGGDDPTAAPAPAADEPWAAGPHAEAAPDAPSADEPWAVTDAEAEPARGDDAGDEPEEDLPWLSTEPPAHAPAAGTEPAAAAPDSAAAAPMPWETGFDLSPELPDASAERPAPRQEPTAEPAAGGFSFEDFFAERPAEPAPPPPAPAPAPSPVPGTPQAPAAQPAPPPAPEPAEGRQGGGEDDEDLESFQAWLQSLKR